MNIDDKHAHLIATALFWYRDQIEDDLEEAEVDQTTEEYMGGLMTREEYIRDSKDTISHLDEVIAIVDPVANSRLPLDRINKQLTDQGLGHIKKGDDGRLSISPDWKEKLKAKIDSLT